MKKFWKPPFQLNEKAKKLILTMKLTVFILFLTLMQVSATVYSQATKFSFRAENKQVVEVLRQIEENSDFRFFFLREQVDVQRKVTVTAREATVEQILEELFRGEPVSYEFANDALIVLTRSDNPLGSVNSYLQGNMQQPAVSGTVTDESGQPLPGVTVLIKGTTQGTVTNTDGNYSLTNIPDDAMLVFSFVGMLTHEIAVRNQTNINVTLKQDVIGIEEVVAIGYGSQRREDLTGSIVSGDMDVVMTQPNVSVMEGLQGTVPGLNIGQVNQAGENPNISIRGQSTLSGEQAPLIVLDGVIFRGELIDINPSDIKSIDVLKDASARAIYGSQASNGVIQIITKMGKGEPSIKYTGRFSVQQPHRELRAETDPVKFMEKIAHSDIKQSRTLESGYLKPNPNWTETTNFKTNHEIRQYELGRSFDWYDYVTTDIPYTYSHNISVTNATEKSNYFASIGYTEQDGHMLDEFYERINGRINLTSSLTNWLDFDLQSFVTLSEYGPQTYLPYDRYIEPFAHPYDENGLLVQRPTGNPINPLIEAKADVLDKRLNFGANLTGTINLPVEGLQYQMKFGNNYLATKDYYFGSHGNSFQGLGFKRNDFEYTMSLDNIITYSQNFNKIHQVDATLLYGIEERNYEFTRGEGANFANHVLGYNRLQAADASLQSVRSGGWKESSLYNMGRISYKLMNRYLVNATIRRDGFSGFSEKNKFGYFPSLALGWVISEESFLKSTDWVDWLKLRVSYGATGNRTIGRYETLAQVTGSPGYVTSDASSIYTHWISALESPNLKWETTTGVNLGIDFKVLNSRLNGSIDYYNNNTTDLLYNVDIPGISRFEIFPDNLGKIHTQGVDAQITSINIRRSNLTWTTNFTFSLNRDVIKELLGFDIDGDGKEDNLISEGLFIDESLGVIYDYEINGIWQLNDDIMSGYEFGSYKVIDQNNDGIIDGDDRIIIGNYRPSFRFGINNVVQYKALSLRIFLNSVQGGKNWYLGEDTMYDFQIFNTEDHFHNAFPKNIDYWAPENPNSKYQRPNVKGASGIAGTQYTSKSFIRLKDISLSYNIKSERIKFIQNMQFILSGRNLLTFTKWPGWDPETGEGITRIGRPVMESYSLGIDVTF